MVAVQVKTIQDAIRNKKQRLYHVALLIFFISDFEYNDIKKLSHTVCQTITLQTINKHFQHFHSAPVHSKIISSLLKIMEIQKQFFFCNVTHF